MRRLRTKVERFQRAYQKRAESKSRASGSPDEMSQRAFRRLKQLQLAIGHVESSAAYLGDTGIEPQRDDDQKQLVTVAQRVLESLEAERERLYRDVHDGPAQVLANAMFEVEYLERTADRAGGEARTALKTELANLKSQFRSSLDSVRGMIYDLRPPVLSELGLSGAIRSYATEYQARYGLQVDCNLNADDTGLEPAHEVANYRVLQEALQNAHKHAQATTVWISWQKDKGQWLMRCTDDGVGFDLVKVARRPRSVGLLAMRERAEFIGARLLVTSTPGQGTAVTLQLPLGIEKEGDTLGR
jgi:two-component system, NarL family, sensor histidine kinase DegS